MNHSSFLFRSLMALVAFFSLFGAPPAHAQTLVYQGQICWQNVSSYDRVIVHFQPNGNSDWDSNMTVNNVTIASTGNGSNYAGQSVYVPGNSISLGWVKVGGCRNWFCASYNPGISYGQCNPTFEDTGVSPNEGYFWFEGYKYINPTLSVSKSANPYTLTVGAVGQYYSIYIGVTNGPTTAVISIADNLPAGFTTSGTISASGGTLYGCPSPGASNLSGCTIASGAYGPITITVPVNVSSAAGTSATNYAYVYGGGDPNCAGGCAGGTTNPVTPANPTLSIAKVLSSNRLIDTDQFTVQINAGTALASATSSGNGSTVIGGATGAYNATAGTSYTLTEVASGTTRLAQYASTMACTNSVTVQQGGTDVSGIRNTGATIIPRTGDVIDCIVKNKQAPTTLALTQIIASGSSVPPGVTFDYNGNNGWGSRSMTSSVEGGAGSAGPTITLSANGVETIVTVALLPGWAIRSISCNDSNGSSDGNGSANFGSQIGNTLHIPLVNVVAGAVLQCAVTMGAAAPTIVVNKLLGGNRVSNNDQFVVQLKAGTTVAVSGSKTAGQGSSVTSGTGTTGISTVTSGTVYNLGEDLAVGSDSSVARYAAVVGCSNARIPVAGGTDLGSVHLLTDTFSLKAGDVITCNVTNTAKAPSLMLTLTQLIISPFPINLMPPFTFNYVINNGWPVLPQPLTTTTFNVPVLTATRPLAASNVDTTLSTNLPDARWFVSSFACSDANTAVSGNQPGNLVRVVGTSITIPAANVRPDAVLKCILTIGHKVP